MAKKNSSILWTVYQSGGNNTADVIGNQGRIKAQDNIGLGDGFIKAAVSNNYVTNVSRDSNSGKLLVNVAQPTLSDLQGMGSNSANKAIVTAGDNDIAQNGTLIAKTLTATKVSSDSTTNVFVSDITEDGQGNITFTTKTLSTATTSAIGGVKSTTTGTTSGRDYYVQVESNGKMKVNVPWENNTHYDSKTVICKTNNGTANTAVTSSETVYLNHVENGGVVSSHKILGTNCNITADSSGHLTIAPVITAPGNAKLKFQFGSANAVETGFTANASSDATYTFPTAATSAYGVTKLMTYGSSTPSSWNTFQTTDDSAVTSKYVYNYATSNFFSRHEVSNPTWDTALNTEGFWKVTNSSSTDSPGTGTWFTLTGDAGTYKAQLAFGDSVQYRTYSNSSWSPRWNTLSAITYTLSGGNAATQAPVYRMYVNPNTGKVIAYTDTALSNSTDLGYLVPKTNIGSDINPVYVDNGEVKACYQLTMANSAEVGGLSSIILSRDDTEHKYFIDAKNYSRYYKYHATVPASGGNPEVPDHFTYPQVGGFLFGDGFGSVDVRSQGSGAPYNYWGVGGSGSTAVDAIPNYYNQTPAVIEAPSVLYAMTTLIDSSSANCSDEIWNTHRLREYDSCSLCRNAVRSLNGQTSYIATNHMDRYTIVGSSWEDAVAFIPPLHWAFISGYVDATYPASGDIGSASPNVEFYLSPTRRLDFQGSNHTPLLHTFSMALHDYNDTCKPTRFNFSFFVYNPLNDVGQYVVWLISSPVSDLSYDLHKQIMIFKTPENGSFDYVYDNYPPRWKPSQT